MYTAVAGIIIQSFRLSEWLVFGIIPKRLRIKIHAIKKFIMLDVVTEQTKINQLQNNCQKN